MGMEMVKLVTLNPTEPNPIRSIGSKSLNNLIGKGLPADRAVLVVGTPGSGKTTLGVQFLLEGAANGENGLHILMEESPQSLTQRFDFLHWNGNKEFTYRTALNEGKITIIDLLSARIGYREKYELSNVIVPPIFRLGDVLGIIYDTVGDNDIKRVVIDSLQSFFLIAEREVVQLREVMLAIVEPYRRVKVGLMAISEKTPMIDDGYNFTEHMFDCVISLSNETTNQPNTRVLQVKKAIWTPHDLRPHKFQINQSGIKIIEPIDTIIPQHKT